MTVFVGHVLNGSLGESITLDTTIRQAFYDTAPVIPTGGEGFLTSEMISGSYTDQGFQQFPKGHTGYILDSFKVLFYNRIVVFPDPIQAGNLIADKTILMSVWNGFFVTRSLASITETNTGGITLGPPAPPTDYGPLEEVAYTLTISVSEGPATINATYDFDFDGTDFDVVGTVLGNRVLALPYLFQAGLRETLSWKTQVITSNNGYEQRIKQRGSPRQGLEFNIAIPRGNPSYLDNLLYGWRGNRFGVPLSSEAQNLTAPTSTSSAVVSADTRYSAFTVGGFALIYNSELDFEVVTILELTDSTITGDQNISKIFTTSAKVMPFIIANLTANPSRHTSGYSQRLSASFVATSNASLATVASTLQYKGLDVFVDDQLSLGGLVRDVYTSDITTVDFDTGLTDTFAPWLKTKIQRSFGVQFENLEDAWNHKLWLHRREGKLIPFWMPTIHRHRLGL